MKNQAESIIERVEAYRASNGEYPAALVSATGYEPKNRYGPWQYSRSGDGRSYRLYTGDFITFVLTYRASSGWELKRID